MQLNSATFNSIWDIRLVAPNARGATVSHSRATPICRAERGTASSTVCRAVHKPVIGDGSNVLSIRAVDLASLDASDWLARSAVNGFTRNLQRTSVLRVEPHLSSSFSIRAVMVSIFWYEHFHPKAFFPIRLLHTPLTCCQRGP